MSTSEACDPPSSSEPTANSAADEVAAGQPQATVRGAADEVAAGQPQATVRGAARAGVSDGWPLSDGAAWVRSDGRSVRTDFRSVSSHARPEGSTLAM